MPIRFNPLPSQEYLNERFDYNPETGELFHKKERPPEHFKRPKDYVMWHSQFAGKRVGTLDRRTGYRLVCVDRKYLLEHRVIWKMAHGEDPVEELDHKDGDKTNNRLANLREATRVDNCRNSKRGVGKSGYRNVQWDSHFLCWKVDVSFKGKKHVFKGFNSPEAADAAAKELRQAVHGGFSVDARHAEVTLTDLKAIVDKYRYKPYSHNTSGVRNVSWDKAGKKWTAMVEHKGKRQHLGRYSTLEEAAQAVKNYRESLQTA